jgi:hypothetical protein
MSDYEYMAGEVQKHIKHVDQFNTGDIILFEHKFDTSSIGTSLMSILDEGISWFSKSRYSHVGIVLKDPEFTNPKLKGLFLLESNRENFPDAETNEIKFGVEIVDLTNVLDNYNGNIYWRKLECERGEKFNSLLASAHSVIHNRPYDLIFGDWAAVALHVDNRNTQRTKTFWCSSLVAYIYTQLGFLTKETKWSLATPKMFGTEKQRAGLQLLNCTLNPEVKIN